MQSSRNFRQCLRSLSAVSSPASPRRSSKSAEEAQCAPEKNSSETSVRAQLNALHCKFLLMADGGTALPTSLRSQCQQRRIYTPRAGLSSSFSPSLRLYLRGLRYHSRKQVAIPWHPTQAKQVQSFPISHTKSRLHSCPV